MLKPLLLPQMVEERRKRESLLDAELNVSQSSDMQESSTPDISSPVTPTFSTRGHVRYGSSISSMDPLTLSPLTESPSSPIFTGMRTSKRSLPDVQEEPQEREEDFDMFDDLQDVYDWSCDDNKCSHRESSMAQSSVQLSTKPGFEYNITDGSASDTELGSSAFKKRRAGDSPFSMIANRLGTRFPLFSRRWRSRKGSNPLSLSDVTNNPRASRAASSRSSSLSNSGNQGPTMSYGDVQMPPTPALSEYDRHDEPYRNSEELNRSERDDGDRRQGLASTPLLPPVMMGDSPGDSDVPVQSPLQSPSVAEPSEPATGFCTPIAGIATPSLHGVPSPPLSTKPSLSSIRRTHPATTAHLIPSSEIPPMVIADMDDKWSNILGHANFTIQPLPYLPDNFDLEACRQLKKDWDLARCNYTRHLVRTGEHYGVTSKTYQLTEEKWKETDDIWRTNNDLTITNTAANGGDAFATLKHKRMGEGEANIMTKIPSLNDPRSEGKFPQLGDEDIVGPMVQATAQLQRTPSKKEKLMKFFAEKFPAGFGRSGA